MAQVQSKNGDIGKLTLLIAITFIMNFLGVLLTAISDRMGDHLAGRMRKFLTEKFYHKVLTLPQSYFDSEISGKIMNQLTRGIYQIQMFTNSFTNFLFPSLLQSVFTIGAMAFYSIPVAFFIFLLFPIYYFLTEKSTKKWGEQEVLKNKIEDVTRGVIS